MNRLLTCTFVALAFLSAPLPAQEDEQGGFLVDLLQDNLSGDNRYIDVTGLEGAFSSQATIKQLTVSDDDGIWLTVSDAVLDWNRLALIRGRFSVNKLSASEIIIARKPKPVEVAADLPEPEATPFQVPELPVSIEIGDLSVARVELGEPLMGKPAELAITGALSLADGSLDTNLGITRLDRMTDKLGLVAGFENKSRQITLDISLAEDSGGLVSELLSIPDRPSILLTAKGEGPVTDFTADIALASDGIQRMGGQVELQSVADPKSDAGSGIGFSANISGDIAPLLAAQYREFFGSDTQLNLSGRSDPDGRLEISSLDILSDALMLNGALDVAGSGQLERVVLQGRISPPEGDDVVLPMGEPRTAIKSAVVSAEFEADEDNGWNLQLGLEGLNRPNLTVSRAQINAGGKLDQQDGMSLAGNLTTAIRGLDFSDDALDDALGSDLVLKGNFAAAKNAVLTLSDFVITGTDYNATVDAEIDGLESGFFVDGRVGINATDLSRFSGISGRDLGGSVSADLVGNGSPLAGMFDFELNVKALGLQSGIATVDPLISGETKLAFSAERDEDGLNIRSFQLVGTGLSADALGSVRSGAANLEFNAKLDDLGRVVPQVNGPVTIEGDLTQAAQETIGKIRMTGPSQSFANMDGRLSPEGNVDMSYDAVLGGIEKFIPQLVGAIKAQGSATRVDGAWDVASDVAGPNGSFAKLAGTMAANGEIDGRYDATIAMVERFVPKFAGSINAKGTATRIGEAWQVASDVKGPSGSVVELAGSMAADGTIDATYDASVMRIERFVPEFPGKVTAKGTAKREAEIWSIYSDATGPGGLDVEVAGTVDQKDLISDISAKGQLQLAAANQLIKPNSVRGTANFDITLKGEPGIESLGGRITTANTTVAIPSVTQAIDDLDAEIVLGNGSATLSVSAGVRAGGRVLINGPVKLTAPFDASIVTEIQQLILTDNVTFESSADGRLAYTGALTGHGLLAGDIRFGETNININAMSGSLGAAPVPDIRHIGEPRAARATRDHAGLIKTSKGGGSGPDIDLDIRLIAENKVFVRGRGLQAELGGNILVRGSVEKAAPSGQINLIRGNLDILGRRLKLTKGLVTLQGKLEPYMEFAATTSTSDGDATLEISGPVTKPQVKVFSQPERPSEEALAMLIFGNQYSELSPIKIAQLAASLATLSGAGGGATDKAREGLGLDTVDFGTDEDGEGQFGAGKYLADGVYTDITVNTKGDTEVNLNLDVTDNLTVKGSVDRQGDTGIGLFFERDY